MQKAKIIPIQLKTVYTLRCIRLTSTEGRNAGNALSVERQSIAHQGLSHLPREVGRMELLKNLMMSPRICMKLFEEEIVPS